MGGLRLLCQVTFEVGLNGHKALRQSIPGRSGVLGVTMEQIVIRNYRWIHLVGSRFIQD